MKKIFLGLFAMSLFNCENDDICQEGTPTTPRLIVEFYDNNNPSNLKTITDLGIKATGMSTGILFANTSKIKVPLKTDQNTLSYDFVLDSQTPGIAITDNITINYTRNDIYISRACGYKTTFNLNDNPNGMVINTPKNWIKEITIQKFIIENENEIHVKIFF